MKDNEPIYPFAIVPTEVFMDTRLTLETMRVLGTLFSFRNKVTGLTFPSREKIAARCGMHPSNISAATTKLVELGWLIKKGKGGYSKPTSYEIIVPEVVAEFAVLHKAKSEAREAERKGIKVAEQTTVAQSATVAEQATRGNSPIGYIEVAQSATREGSPIGYTQITDKLTDQLTDKKATELPAPKKSGAPQKSSCPGSEVWNAYSTAYFNRYGTEPVRNAKVNGVIGQLIKRIGVDEAPHIADFYVKHNKKIYVERLHDVSLMLADAEGLRTQWATNRTMTARRASEIDDTATNAGAVNEAIEMLRRRNGHAAV